MSEWNPDDPLLTAQAPHELAGILRWHRAKVPSQEIVKLLRLRGTKFLKSLELAQKQEAEARQIGRPIHDALIPKEKT